MTKFILGKKLGMSQVFAEDGRAVPVTVIEAGPCVVIQVRTQEKDGYDAIQIGLGVKRKVSKPLEGHFKGLEKFRWTREFKISAEGGSVSAGKNKEKKGKKEDEKGFKRGDKIDVSVFEEGEKVKVSGISKGKGFQGVVKRHGFHGGPASHGQKHTLRAPGSIGSAFPEKVFKGMRMAGRMGSERVSTKNLQVVKIDPENNLIAVKGAVPGNRGSLIEIRSVD